MSGIDEDAEIAFADWANEREQEWIRRADGMTYSRIRAAFIRAYLEGRKDGGR